MFPIPYLISGGRQFIARATLLVYMTLHLNWSSSPKQQDKILHNISPLVSTLPDRLMFPTVSYSIVNSCHKRWKIHDEKRKAYVLMTCNHKWRSYKKRLKKNFLVNENVRNPLETYSYLEKTALQKFKERISSKEFQDISEKARMSSMCNTNPARAGPHGYRGNKSKWEQEKASGELPSQLYEIKSERSLDYVLGRRSKNESGSKIIPPNMEPIVKKLIDVQKEIFKGDLLPGPGEDLLTMAIGPEHPGRTRAVGHDIGLRKGMQGLDIKKRKARDKEAVSNMQVQLDQVMTELAELRTKFAMQESRNQVPNNVCFGVQNNSSGSTSRLDALDTIKVIIYYSINL
ncbi:unnamed protein product [Lactuca virosa]|uniref:Uncharacterized protein n=1 Tax=Lactuca virosa TaxID=75947 RepID=A0AAU9N7F9_9ASTR|nr:unnamed protein product [Lactuca virosa]